MKKLMEKVEADGLGSDGRENGEETAMAEGEGEGESETQDADEGLDVMDTEEGTL